jgi:hypothetical protein
MRGGGGRPYSENAQPRIRLGPPTAIAQFWRTAGTARSIACWKVRPSLGETEQFMADVQLRRPSNGLVARLNGRQHRAALNVFLFVVLAHWAEHLVQAYQIWVLGRPTPQARGVLGQFFPWLVKSEYLHYGYAIVMLVGLFLLRPGFVGRAKTWWTVALLIQFWHHVEHLLLLIQVQAGVMFFGASVPTSVAQLVIPRVELHLFYNSVVFIPMVIAMYLHLRPNESELRSMDCSCVARAYSVGSPSPSVA